MTPTETPILLLAGFVLLVIAAVCFACAFIGWLIERSPLRRWADFVARIIGGGGPWRIP